MKLTTARYEEAQENNEGFCTRCETFTCDDVEPDADGYDCPECQNPTVMGAENALIYEHLEITDEEDDDDSIGIISLSDED